MPNRWNDRLRQAERDLEQARDSRASERHGARYPNGHPSGAPFEHYGPLQSEKAIDHADEILEFVRSRVA